jgi:GNAT superfamily N-acetyltransferase
MLRALSLLPSVLKTPILRHRLRFRERDVVGLRAEVASSGADALAAARLVHDSYAKRGIIDAHPSRVRVTPAQLHPSSFIIVAKHRQRVVGTVTLQVDSPFGLMMDEDFAAAVAPFRKPGRLLAEVGALAIVPAFRGTGVFHLLNRAMFTLAEAVGVDDLLAVVSTWASDIYRALLCFHSIGEVRAYRGLDNPVPAAALRLPLENVRERYRRDVPQSYSVYFERSWDEIALPAMVSRESHDEGRLDVVRALAAARSDVLRSLPRREVDELRRAVPDLYWPSPSQLDPRELTPMTGLDATLVTA